MAWTEVQPAGAVDKYWRAGALDADGSHQIAGIEDGRLWLSTNYGVDWTEQRPAGNVDAKWRGCLAIDADGSTIMAGASGGRLYLSTNSGGSWSEIRPAGNANKNWNCAAMDDDGSVIVAGVSSGRLYLSTDTGANWSEIQPAGSSDCSWYDCTCDSDGSVIVAVNDDSHVYVSQNTGISWASPTPAGGVTGFRAVDCSSDGAVIVAANNQRCYLSSDTGANWSETQPAGDVARSWTGVALDAAGTKMMACCTSTTGRVYVYVDGSWSESNPLESGTAWWLFVAMSAMGGRTLTTASTKLRLYLDTTFVSAPNAPTLTAPVGAESWREGSTQSLTYTAASPEQDEGAVCEYEFEFSAAGDFTDTVSVITELTGGTYSWTLPYTLVAANASTCKVRVRAKVPGLALYSTYDTSGALTIGNSTAPTVTLVTPLDEALLAGLTPIFVFGTADIESDDVHVEFQTSTFADFRDYHIDTDSETDYADWEEAADPFTTWTTVPSGGATPGNRIRYQTQDAFRYDVYHGRVLLKDIYSTAAWTTLSFTISVDSALALSVTIDGTSYDVSRCVIVENTGGEASPIDLEINLAQHLANPITKGAEIAIASGLGDHNRSWNGTVESWHFTGTAVAVHALQDDAYLSRKIVTGDEASADLGANLKDFVDDYGTPLTGAEINVTTGTNMALTGGYKFLREHFEDALGVLPSYLVWVDSGADIHFVDQDGLAYPTIELYEEDPS